ncbi:MAG: invasion associated locus B family protein [Pseudolabrys sp.]|nr:invasion associated locus B family protein [Pseudolabrys sp.]
MKSTKKSSGMFYAAAGVVAATFVLSGSLVFAQSQQQRIPRSDTPAPRADTAPRADAATTGVQTDMSPTSTSASYGDWILRCQRLGAGAEVQRVCEVVQQVRAQDQQNPTAEIAIGRVKKSDPLMLTVVLPVNVTFPNNPNFSSSGKTTDTVDLGWRRCLPGGCFADLVLKDDVLKDWKSQTNVGRLTWKDAAGRDFAVGISSKGLTQAIDALSKEQ